MPQAYRFRAAAAVADCDSRTLPALHAAAAEARRRGGLTDTSSITLDGLDRLRTLAKQRLDATLREADLPGATAVIAGSAETVIVQYAESVGAELVVVGTRGRSGLSRLMLGSTAVSVIESAPCAVLVVRILG